MIRLLLLSLLLASASAQEPTRVLSSDGKVVVSGSTPSTAAAVLRQVTELREELALTIIEKTEANRNRDYDLTHNLILTLVPRIGNGANERQFLQTIRPVEGSKLYRIELAISLAKSLNREEIRRELLECLLLDRAIQGDLSERNQLRIPPWIVTGLLERFRWRSGESNRALYRSLAQRGVLFDIEELLTLKAPRKLNSAKSSAFQVSSGAFVMGLLKQPRGLELFQNLVQRLPSFDGEPVLLIRQYFPEIGLSPESLAKWWALQLQVLTEDFVTQTLDLLQSEEALNKALATSIEAEDGTVRVYKLENTPELLALKETSEFKVFQSKTSEKLQLLSYNCFPSYRPVIGQYLKILSQLNKEKESDLQARLDFLRNERELLQSVGIRARDYLDWFQITTATSTSGAFNDFLELKQELDTQTTPSPGPIGQYLDRVQALYD